MMPVYRALRNVRPAPLGAAGKWILRIRRRCVETNQGAFWVDPASKFGLALLESGEYEPGLLRVLQTFLYEGATFIDVGANEGYFSVVASKLVGPKGRVYAVEPQNRLQRILREHIDLNGADNITLLQCAISAQNDAAILHLSPDTNSGASSLHRSTRYRLPTQAVETRTLSNLLAGQGISHCDLMKIDIEGHEHEAILGSPEVFTHGRVAALAIDIHHALLAARGCEPSDITKILLGSSYHPDPRFTNGVTVWVR